MMVHANDGLAIGMMQRLGTSRDNSHQQQEQLLHPTLQVQRRHAQKFESGSGQDVEVWGGHPGW